MDNYFFVLEAMMDFEKALGGDEAEIACVKKIANPLDAADALAEAAAEALKSMHPNHRKKVKAALRKYQEISNG